MSRATGTRDGSARVAGFLPYVLALAIGTLAYGFAGVGGSPVGSSTDGTVVALLRSRDGMAWTGASIAISESGSEPDLASIGGDLAIVFRSGNEFRRAWVRETASVADPMRLAGLPPGQIRSPSVVPLGDGRTRMFFVFTPADSLDHGGPRTQVRSALLVPDGTWEVEPGIRFAAHGLRSVDVIGMPNGEWRLFYEQDEHGIRVATSEDGVWFALLEGAAIESGIERGSIPRASFQGDALRVWFARDEGDARVLDVRESADGKTFRAIRRPVRLPELPLDWVLRGLESPAVAQDAAGGWWLAIAVPPPDRSLDRALPRRSLLARP